MQRMTRRIRELRIRETQRTGCLGSLGDIEVDVLVRNGRGDVAQLVE
jgi:hypothetical protein